MHPFTLSRPADARDAIAAHSGDPQSSFIAGGTDLIGLMKDRAVLPAHVIDINGLPGMSDVDARPDGSLRIGALARMSDVAAHPAVRSLIDEEVKRLTAHLAQWETIKRFALLPEDFTFDNGSLTFTLKLKRRVVEQQYSAVIESLYADVAEPRPILQD